MAPGCHTAIVPSGSGTANSKASQVKRNLFKETWSSGLVQVNSKQAKPRRSQSVPVKDALPTGMSGAIAHEIAQQERPVQFYTWDAMLPVLKNELDSATVSICGLQYQADHTELFVRIIKKTTLGVRCRILFDRDNFKCSSSATQAPRCKELYDSGCELRVMKPPGGGFAIMHVKTLIVDDRTVLLGSVNWTHNGLERNKEHLLRITDPPAVAEISQDFEREWSKSEVVGAELVREMMDAFAKREAAKEAGREIKRKEREERERKKQEEALAKQQMKEWRKVQELWEKKEFRQLGIEHWATLSERPDVGAASASSTLPVGSQIANGGSEGSQSQACAAMAAPDQLVGGPQAPNRKTRRAGQNQRNERAAANSRRITESTTQAACPHWHPTLVMENPQAKEEEEEVEC